MQIQINSPAEYERALEPHKRAMAHLQLNLDFFLRDLGQVAVFSVSSRMKHYPSAMAKAARINLSICELDDLAGIRIIVGTAAEVPIIEHFFTRQAQSEDLRVIKRVRIERTDGYRAIHLVVEVRPSYQRSALVGRIEVQLQTIFENAFNFLSRQWNYKQPWLLSKEWKTSFSKASTALSQIEEQVSNLYREMALQASLAEDVALTPYSLQLIVKSTFHEDLSIEECVDFCGMFSDAGFLHNAHFRDFLANKEIEGWYARSQTEPPMSSLLSTFSGLSRFSFWSFVGVRLHDPNLRELLLRPMKSTGD